MIRPCTAALCLVLSAAWSAEAPPDERIAANQEFRRSFDAGEYAAALPAAGRVVELTQNQFGADSLQMVNPLTNLGTAYYRLRNYGEALDRYRQALTILDLAGNSTDARLVRPLHGMGAALRGLQRDSEAVTPLRRAVEILRNREGLYTATQLPLMKELIASYIATGQVAEAGREQQYAFNVAETAFGKEDLRLLQPLDEYAQWQELAGQYTAARLLHARAVQIADAKLGSANLQAIPGLRGIARTYRLAYLNGESEESTQAAIAMQEQLAPTVVTRVNSPSNEGERALRAALERVNASSAPQPALRALVLIDLGDWHLISGGKPRALAAYHDAWEALGPEAAARQLGTPQELVYRPPSIAVSRRQQNPDTHDEQEVKLRLHVAADGDVREAIVVNAAPEREAAERAVIAAVKRSLFRPAFRDGAAVAATDVEFTERVYVRRPKEKEAK